MSSIHVLPLRSDGYASLAAWTGESAEQIQCHVEDDHERMRDHWLAWDGDSVIGALHPWRSPDGRLRLYFDRCRNDAWSPLVAKIDGPALATIHGSDTAAGDALTDLGFRRARVELVYEIPVAWHETHWPAGIHLVSAADVAVEDVMRLDTQLRQDIPGSGGWTEDLQWFREENHQSPYFDPDCYLVAENGTQQVGLLRIWNGPSPLPQLGLVGVLPDYRGRGLATAMVAQALSVWAGRGGKVVTAEVDEGNRASRALMSRFGGCVTGSQVEYERF